MNNDPSDPAYEKRAARLLLDVLIRAGLILALVMLCYRVFAPFLVLMVWALILAITLYPLHRALAARMRGRSGLSLGNERSSSDMPAAIQPSPRPQKNGTSGAW